MKSLKFKGRTFLVLEIASLDWKKWFKNNNMDDNVIPHFIFLD